MKSFELQLFRDGSWKTDSTYADRAVAEMEARRMEESARHISYRVVEETYDERTNTNKDRTVYRDKRFQEVATQITESGLQRMEAQVKHQSNDGKFKGRRAPKKNTTKLYKIVLNLGIIGLAGIAGMWMLQYFSTMK